jgi:recombination protein RecT
MSKDIVSYMRQENTVSRFEDVVGKSANIYISSTLAAVAGSKRLQACTPESIFISSIRAANLELTCDPDTGHAYLVPFGDKATLIIGYKGLNQLALRSGKYRYISVIEIFEGQEVKEEFPSGLHTRHGSKTSNVVNGYIGAFELRDGYTKTVYMSIEEIHEHADQYSKTYKNKDSAWKTATRDMERKTVFRKLMKWGYLDPTYRAILDVSDEVYENGVEDAPEIIEVGWTAEQLEVAERAMITEPIPFLDSTGLPYDATPAHIEAWIRTYDDTGGDVELARKAVQNLIVSELTGDDPEPVSKAVPREENGQQPKMI